MAVRGGGHFYPVANLIARFFLDAGYLPEAIRASWHMVKLSGLSAAIQGRVKYLEALGLP